MSNSKEDLAVIIRADATQLTSDLQRASASFRSFAAQIERVAPKTIATDNHTAALRDSAKAAGEAKANYAAAASGLSGFIGKAAVAGGALIALETGFTGVSSAIELVKDSVRMAADLEQTSIAFETMLGSAEKAASVMADLRKFAYDTPFSNNDVTAGARQLLAYGVAVDQLIPTLNLIGNASASTASSLKDNLRTYGQVMTAGVLHQQDLNEFTQRGFNLNPHIAKVKGIDVSQVRKAIENSQVDKNDFLQAFIALDKAQFSGGLEKQAKSLKGAFEQLGDAWDMTKLKLGQVIVRETGLYQITKDAESFSKMLGRSIGSPEFARGVRFVADLTKGVAQLAYEVGRMQFITAPVWLEHLGREFPAIQRAAAAFHDLLIDAQNFKFDDEKLLTAAWRFATEASIGFNVLIKRAEDFGEKLDNNVLKPLEKIASRLGDLDNFLQQPLNKKMEMLLARPGVPVAPEKAPLPGTDKEVLAEYGRLKTDLLQSAIALQTAKFRGENQIDAQARYQAANQRFNNFLGNFKGEDILSLDRGIVPKRVENPPAKQEITKTWEQQKREQSENELQQMLAILRRDKLERSAGRARDILGASGVDAFGQMLLTPAAGPLSVLGQAYPGIGKGIAPPKLDNSISPHFIELANKLNERYFPAESLKNQLADLNKLRELGLINGDVFDKARGNVVRETAERLGLGGETRLASAADVGSAEDARLIARFRAGQGGANTTDQLLALILAELRKGGGLSGLGKEIANLMPTPIDFSGGGDFGP